MILNNLKFLTVNIFNPFRPKNEKPKFMGGLPNFNTEKEALTQFIIKCEYECGFFDKEETNKQLSYCITQIETRFPDLAVNNSYDAKKLYQFKERVKDINDCLDEYSSPNEIRELLNDNPIED
jgi:hypothetical protein